MQLDVRVLELLSSKLCHDLISPVSAINNGVELIEDIGGSVVEEAMKLIGDSAVQASRRLRLFRLAYGRAGSEEGLAQRDVRQVAEQYAAGGKMNLKWTDSPLLITERRGALKVILNLVVLCEELLAYGGVTEIVAVEGVDSPACRFELSGRNAQITPHVQEALDGVTAIEALTPRSIQAYMTGRFASHFDLHVSCVNAASDRLDITLSAPQVIASA